MEAGAAVEAAGEGERWTASTNWIVSGGSLRDVVSFETSEEDAPALTSSPLLLRLPATQHEFLPCEVTVRLNGKHELHRIYVRSTARVYEIYYYAADKQNYCTEYLCTVRCSVAAAEVTPVSSLISTDCDGGSNATLEKQDKISIAESNCSNEDGWVEVVPDSPSHDHKINALSREEDRNSNTDFQVNYEATADISDLSSCMSVTLRFLSLQTKTCVRISEIYIYADPVETPSQDDSVAMGEKYGGSSLLAMFMPSLLQLSQSTASRQGKKLLDISRAHNYQDGVQKETEIPNSGMKITFAGEESSDKTDLLPGLSYAQSQLKPDCKSSGWNQSISDQVADLCLADRKLDQVHEQSQIKAENVQLGSNQKMTEEEASSSKTAQLGKEKLENVQLRHSEKQSYPDQVSKFSVQENYVAVDHIEKVLNELASRVSRIETFCSRFEESLLKPLNSIDARLEKLESVLATVAAGDQLCRPGGCSKISGPHISAEGSGSEKRDILRSSSTSRDDTVYDSSLPADVRECPSLASGVTTVPESRKYQGFVMKAPEFSSEDSPSPADVMECPSLAAGVTNSVPDSRTYQGFVMKAPEIISDDDMCLKNDSLASEISSYSTSKKFSDIDNEDDVHIRNDSGLASDVKFVEGKKVSSVDSALASALEAFLTSKPRPNVMEPCGISTGDESSLNFSVVGVVCNETDRYVEASNEAEETTHSNSSLSAAAASKTCARNYGKDDGCGISSIIALDDSPTPLDTFFSSLTCDKNNDKDSTCGISGILKVSAALDDSSKPLNTLISCLQSSLMDSGLRLKAPDFPSNEDECHNCSDTCHKEQAFMRMNGDSAPSLVASPSLSELNTSKCSSNLVDTSSGSNNLVKNATSPVDGLPTENHVNKAVGDFGLREFTSSDEIKQCSSMEGLLEGSDDFPLECCPENEEDKMKFHQCCSTSAVTTDERLLMEEMSCGNKSSSDLTDLHGGQTGIANGSSDVVVKSHTASEDNITLITNIYDEFLGHEIEQTSKSAACSCDHLWEAKFVPQEDWIPGVPLETLLGETCDDRDQVSATRATDKLNAGDELLEGMPSFAFPADNSGLCNDVGESSLNVDIDAFGHEHVFDLL